MRRVFGRLSLGVLVLGAIFAGYVAANFEALLDEYAPFDLREPPNRWTPVHFYYLRTKPGKCYAALTRGGIGFSRATLDANARGCGYEDGAIMTRATVSYGGGVLLRCPTLVSLAMWERHALQQEAQRVLNKKVRSIQTFGTYSCRNVNNAKNGRLSQHATANAIDIAGFTFEDGSAVTVLRDWEKGDGGKFLHAVRDRACEFFNGVLSPDYNAAHANHFHFDMGWWKVCR